MLTASTRDDPHVGQQLTSGIARGTRTTSPASLMNSSTSSNLRARPPSHGASIARPCPRTIEWRARSWAAHRSAPVMRQHVQNTRASSQQRASSHSSPSSRSSAGRAASVTLELSAAAAAARYAPSCTTRGAATAAATPATAPATAGGCPRPAATRAWAVRAATVPSYNPPPNSSVQPSARRAGSGPLTVPPK